MVKTGSSFCALSSKCVRIGNYSVIPRGRILTTDSFLQMKVPKIVAGSVQADVEIIAEQPCDGLVCGTHGACQDDTGAAVCMCDAGYETPLDCEAGDCVCSRQSCAAKCASCSAAATQAYAHLDAKGKLRLMAQIFSR